MLSNLSISPLAIPDAVGSLEDGKHRQKIFDESIVIGQLYKCALQFEEMTYFDNFVHPPPTRTITVWEHNIRQKQSFGSWSPIQYSPLRSFQVSATIATLMFTRSLLTTSPMATSSLFFGFAMWAFLFLREIFLGGEEVADTIGNDSLGACAHIEAEVEVGAHEGVTVERDWVETSEKVGELVLFDRRLRVRKQWISDKTVESSSILNRTCQPHGDLTGPFFDRIALS
jgi:hypothetical protein